MGDARRCRDVVVAELRRYFRQRGLEEVPAEDNADRSVVVGPPRPWIFVGDSAGTTVWDEEGFDSLSLALSTQAPVVATKMSDGAAVHFYLYRHGRLVDKFGNAAFPFYHFASEEEAAPFRGRPELWADLLVDPGQVSALRAAWVQEWQAGDTLATTARLLGWEPALLWVGYTHDADGSAIKYDEFLEVDLAEFEEFHFAHVRRPTG
jgi:hypothetical protein